MYAKLSPCVATRTSLWTVISPASEILGMSCRTSGPTRVSSTCVFWFASENTYWPTTLESCVTGFVIVSASPVADPSFPIIFVICDADMFAWLKRMGSTTGYG